MQGPPERGELDFSVVMPAWNEANRIGTTLAELTRYFHDQGKSHDFEILVVVDNADDGTADIVTNMSRTAPEVRALRFSERLGKGEATRRGIMASRGRVVALADADGSSPPGEILKLVHMAEAIDGAVGSRWLGNGTHTDQPWLRRIASRSFNGLVRLFLKVPVTDTQCGYKAFWGASVREVLPEVAVIDYSFDVDVLWKLCRHGYRIAEVPIAWSHKDGSKLQLTRVVPMMGATILGLRFANSRAGILIGPDRLLKLYHFFTRTNGFTPDAP